MDLQASTMLRCAELRQACLGWLGLRPYILTLILKLLISAADNSSHALGVRPCTLQMQVRFQSKAEAQVYAHVPPFSAPKPKMCSRVPGVRLLGAQFLPP